jgi:hypothetical protein
MDGNSEESGSGDSSKENKANSQMESEKSEKSNSGADADMGGSTAGNPVFSPAPSIPSALAAPVVAASA